MHRLNALPLNYVLLCLEKSIVVYLIMLFRLFRNLVKYDSLPEEIEALTKIRYKDPGAISTISGDKSEVKVEFHREVKAIAPGQSAVFYEDKDLIGGGIIQ